MNVAASSLLVILILVCGVQASLTPAASENQGQLKLVWTGTEERGGNSTTNGVMVGKWNYIYSWGISQYPNAQVCASSPVDGKEKFCKEVGLTSQWSYWQESESHLVGTVKPSQNAFGAGTVQVRRKSDLSLAWSVNVSFLADSFLVTRNRRHIVVLPNDNSIVVYKDASAKEIIWQKHDMKKDEFPTKAITGVWGHDDPFASRRDDVLVGYVTNFDPSPAYVGLHVWSLENGTVIQKCSGLNDLEAYYMPRHQLLGHLVLYVAYPKTYGDPHVAVVYDLGTCHIVTTIPGMAQASFTLTKDHVLASSYKVNMSGSFGVLAGFDVKTGAKLWQREQLLTFRVQTSRPSAPLAEKGVVFQAFNGILGAYEEKTGTDLAKPINLYGDCPTVNPYGCAKCGSPALYTNSSSGFIFAGGYSLGSSSFSDSDSTCRPAGVWYNPAGSSKKQKLM